MSGWCLMFQRMQGWAQVSDVEIAEGRRLARMAIEAGKEDPDTHWMRGHVTSFFGGDHAAAASAIDRALLLNPNSAYAWMASGWTSCFQHLSGPAIEALKRATRLSPLDPLGYMFAAGRALAHRYEEGLEWAERSLGNCRAITWPHASRWSSAPISVESASRAPARIEGRRVQSVCGDIPSAGHVGRIHGRTS